MPDISKLKVVELREELTKRGLNTTGLKAVLVARLQQAHADSAAAGNFGGNAVVSNADHRDGGAASAGTGGSSGVPSEEDILKCAHLFTNISPPLYHPSPRLDSTCAVSPGDDE